MQRPRYGEAQELRLYRLGEEVPGARCHRAQRQLMLRVRCEHNHRHRGKRAEQCQARLWRALRRHNEIEEDEIRPGLRGKPLKRLPGILRRHNIVPLSAEPSPGQPQESRLVIGEKNAALAHAGTSR